MLRAAIRPCQRTLASRRSFVSSVLLSKTWENETLATLRTEAKNRGLSSKGNKSTLITRIQDFEKSNALNAVSPQDPVSPVPSSVRHASTAPVAETPGIPPASQPKVEVPSDFLKVSLPDISQPDPEPPVEIPYLPDFWDSAAQKAKPTESAQELPKIVVVGGSATHHGGGPSHHLQSDHEALSHLDEDVDGSSGKGGFWHDVANDIGLPTSIRKQSPAEMADGSAKANSRALNKEEARGVWVLLGIFAGSFVAGGIFNGKPPADDAPKEQPASSA